MIDQSFPALLQVVHPEPWTYVWPEREETGA